MNLKRRNKLIWEEQPPWTWDQIWFSVFESQEKTNTTINQLPGSKICNDIDSLRFLLEIFLDSIEDLSFSINTFKEKSEKSNFWYRSNEAILENLEKKINRGIFSSTLAAMSLVDSSRNFSKKYQIDDYQEKVNGSFKENPNHVFIQSLRNYFAHVKISQANWNISQSKTKRKVSFLLYKKELLKWSNWNALVKEYINSCREGVDVEVLFKEYSESVKKFHAWHMGAVSNKYVAEISKYKKYSKKVKGVHAYCQWNLLIQQAYLPKGLDPYDYLERHLTETELEEVLSMPHKSEEQVDRIIEILDEYEVCDDNLRELIYKLFRLDQSPKQ